MAESDFAGLGFAPGVVRGVRSFRVNPEGMLTGIHYQQVWQPGENDAECRRDADAWNLGSWTITAKQAAVALQQMSTAASNLAFLADIPQKRPWYRRAAEKFWDILEECVAFIVDDVPAFFRGLYEKFQVAHDKEDTSQQITTVAVTNAFPPGYSNYQVSIKGGYVQVTSVTGSTVSSKITTVGDLQNMIPISGNVSWAGSSLESDEPKEHSFETCACGFYGYYDGSDDYYREGYVSAVVEGYGETLIGTRGFRAMKARIVALYIPSNVKRPGLAYQHTMTGRIYYPDSTLRNDAEKRADSEALAAKIRENYPGVPVFHAFSAMVAEFPPDKGEE